MIRWCDDSQEFSQAREREFIFKIFYRITRGIPITTRMILVLHEELELVFDEYFESTTEECIL